MSFSAKGLSPWKPSRQPSKQGIGTRCFRTLQVWDRITLPSSSWDLVSFFLFLNQNLEETLSDFILRTNVSFKIFLTLQPQTPFIKTSFLFCFVLFVFWDRVSLCSPGCPGAHSVDQAGLKLRNPPASTSQVLGLKACAILSEKWTWEHTQRTLLFLFIYLLLGLMCKLEFFIDLYLFGWYFSDDRHPWRVSKCRPYI